MNGKNMRKVLTYGIGEEHWQILRNLFPDVLLKTAGNDPERTVGDLLDHQTENVPEQADTEFLIFSGWQNDEIGAFVSRLRNEGYGFDGILVSETETNRQWTLRTLIGETMEEHRYFRERTGLIRLLKYCETLDQKQISQKTAQAVMTAFAALNDSESSADDLKHCGIFLAAALEEDGLI